MYDEHMYEYMYEYMCDEHMYEYMYEYMYDEHMYDEYMHDEYMHDEYMHEYVYIPQLVDGYTSQATFTITSGEIEFFEEISINN